VSRRSPRRAVPAGSSGWDDYADYYDWENARTMALRDVPFWRTLAQASAGPVLELGCGTGRVTAPLARAKVDIVGIDLSAPMLARARARLRRARLTRRARLVRGDIRTLPFPDATFDLVIAPYGILQSLLQPRDLSATLASAHRVLRPGGRFVTELVADLPAWKEYTGQTRLRGWRSGGRAYVTLVESVRQDRRRGLTIFDQRFVERRGRTERTRTFQLTFRTLTVPQMTARLTRAGLHVTARLGDYDGGPWHPGSETWLLMAERPAGPHP